MENYLHSKITKIIISTFYKVYNELGYGFLEKVYERALFYELSKNEVHVVRQAPIKVRYDGIDLGVYYADLLVEDCVIVEIKSAEALCKAHEAQLVNYLKASSIEVGILLNFGENAEVKRKVFSDRYKNHKKSI
jgi:GxxExxY protein